MKKSPIIITGFMGSGKTTVAQALARALDCEALDLDKLIFRQTGRTPKEIIEQDGEPAFREVETEMLRTVLDEGSARVIALGGGAWTVRENREMIAQHDGFSVWLDAPFELCWQRIADAGSERPLAPDKQQALALYEQRRALYEIARLHVTVDEGQSLEALTSQILSALLER
jgi:shikimate kinase